MKSKTRILFIMLIMLFIVILWTNHVNATEEENYMYYAVAEKGNVTANVVDKIPTKFKVDVKWIDYKKGHELILKQIVDILKSEGINMKIVKVNYANGDYESIANKDKINVWSYGVEDITISIDCDKVSKQISIDTIKDITYSNSGDYNEADKKYIDNVIKNLKLPNIGHGQYDISQYSELGREDYRDCLEIVKEVINDNSIQLVKGNSGSGWGDILSHGGDFRVGLFKNDVYYGEFYGIQYLGYKITVLDSVEDTEEAYINYALPIVRKYINEDNYIKGTVTLKRESGSIYSVLVNGEEPEWEDNKILIKKVDKTVKLGDVNSDGKVNTKDAREVLLTYIGKKTLTTEQKQAADVNKDGKVNTKDARQILLYYIGKIKQF